MYFKQFVMLGDNYVGKTSLCDRFVHGRFPRQTCATIGAAFLTKTVLMEGITVDLDIWDTAGHQAYNSLTVFYIRGVSGIIVIYDITQQTSFVVAKEWLEKVDRLAPLNAERVLVGNKCDLVENRQVEFEDAKRYADKVGIPFMEISTKDSADIEQVFMSMLRSIVPVLKLVVHEKPGPKKENCSLS
jgi:Ras-related protein Rab-1A